MNEFLDKLKKFDIILGSNSPRRKSLLMEAHIPFRVLAKSHDESFNNGLKPEEVAILLSNNKAKAYGDIINKPGVILITADTIVISESKIINKPENKQHAIEMLKTLSGKTHEVITGVSIRTKNKTINLTDSTFVTFKAFTEEEIIYYIEQFQPYDKAGSYGLQEWIGTIGIERIEGSYQNVIGLPVHKVYEALKDIVNFT